MDLKKVVNEVVEHSGGVDNIRSVEIGRAHV